MKVNENGVLTLDAGAGEAAVEKSGAGKPLEEKRDAKYPRGDQANYDLSKVWDRLGVMPVEVVAELMGVQPQTLATWRTNGTGPTYIKAAKTILYKYEHVQEWFACNEVTTNRTLGGGE